MPNPVNVLPDAELALIQYLKARTEITALIPAARITTALPPQPTYPCVTVTRMGGSALVWQRIDEPDFQVEVWGGSRFECNTLARTVRACIMSIRNDTVSAGVLVSAGEQVGMQWMPDDVTVPPTSRFVGRFSVLIHP